MCFVYSFVLRLGLFCSSPEGSGCRVNFNSNTDFLARGNTQKQSSGTEENKRILEEGMVSLDSESKSAGLSSSIVKALGTGLRFEPRSTEGKTEFAAEPAGTACLLTQMTKKPKILYSELRLQVKSGPLSFFVNNFCVCVDQRCAHLYMNHQKT